MSENVEERLLNFMGVDGKKQVPMRAGQPCPVCSEPMLDENFQGIKRPIWSEVGVVHQACYLPYLAEDQMKIHFRTGTRAIGDTIAVTPAIRELRRLYPKAYVTVGTVYPDLFKYNPYINNIIDYNTSVEGTRLDGHAFELLAFNVSENHHYAIHGAEFASFSAFSHSLLPTCWDYDIFYRKGEAKSATQILYQHGINPNQDKCIILCPHKTEWETRDWGMYFMPELARRIHKQFPEHKIISLGGRSSGKSGMENFIPLPPEVSPVNLYGKLDLLETCAFLDMPCAKLLVSPDTGSLHLAASRKELPVVGVFTVVKAHFRTPVRNQKYSHKFIGVEADTGCNCTYMDARQITNDAKFDICPKRTLIERTKQTSVYSAEQKLHGLQNYIKDLKWDIAQLDSQMDAGLEHFRKDKLPCFPSVDKVMEACATALARWP